MRRPKKKERRQHSNLFSNWKGVAFDWINEADEALEFVVDSMKFENLTFRIEIEDESTVGNLIEVNDACRIKPIQTENDKHEYLSIHIKIVGKDGSILNQSRYEKVLKLVKVR